MNVQQQLLLHIALLLISFVAFCFASPTEKGTKLEQISHGIPFSDAQNDLSANISSRKLKNDAEAASISNHQKQTREEDEQQQKTSAKKTEQFVFDYAAANGGKKSIELDGQFLMNQILDAEHWALLNGLITWPKLSRCFFCEDAQRMDDLAQAAPFSLFPSPFPRALFHQAMDVQKAIQLLYFRAIRDFAFLKEMHSEVLELNEGFRQTVQFIEDLYSDGFRQPLTLFCQRSDYMAHQSINEENNEQKIELKQIILLSVEVNTGPIGGFGTSTRISKLHRRMLFLAGADTSASMVPPNQTDTMVAQALHAAWKQFGNREAVVLFLFQSRQNILLFESRQVQFELERISKGQIKCFFLTLREGIKRLKLDPNNFSLILDDKLVVAVVLHRYSSGSVNSFELKFSRMIVRRSTAIQNSYRLLLAHTKRMQQIFTMPGVVERFFHDPQEAHLVKAIRQVFTKSWSIGEDDEEAEEIIRKVKMNSDNYVMKWNHCDWNYSSRDIFFGNEIPEKLNTMTKFDRTNMLIMEKLNPMIVKNHFVYPNEKPLLNVEVTPELGIFGCLLGNMADGTVLQYFDGGHQMKTKLASENEGGIWKGKSVYDSPYLV